VQYDSASDIPAANEREAAATPIAARAPTGSAAREGLYQELVLEHFRRPHGKGPLATSDAIATVRNPLCGEEITVAVALDHGGSERRVLDVGFTGDGCSISQASASMMTDAVRGRTVEEIAALTAHLRALVRGDAMAALDDTLGPLRALSGVARVPARAGCALMAWEALARAVGGS
jgi:nitrogen fixation NifU-like protein